MVVQAQKITVWEFEAFLKRGENAGRLFELVIGEIEEKVPTEEHSRIVIKLIVRLELFLQQTGAGRVNTEAAYRLPNDDENYLLPDVSVTSADRLQPVSTQGTIAHMPDWYIEIKSPTDSYKKLRRKKDYYLENGVRLVWLIFPEKRIIEIYTLDDDGIYTSGDTLDGDPVLPDFRITVDEVFGSH